MAARRFSLRSRSAVRANDAIFELVGVALHALAQLRLAHRDGERAGHLLCDFDGPPLEGLLVG